MIQPTTLEFLSNLKTSNTKEWFDAHRSAYESARENIIDMASQLIEGISQFDGTIAMSMPEPKKCISRIYRDVRFSKNKSPYKTNFFILIRHNAAKKEDGTGYYVQIQPGDASFTGGGVYMPMPPDLYRLRLAIDEHYDVWQRIIEEKAFCTRFPGGVLAPESLRNVPKGFERDSPAAEYLKMKGYYTARDYTDAAMQSKTLVKNILEDFRIAYPMMAFLQKALG